jgi:hypothetical protein
VFLLFDWQTVLQENDWFGAMAIFMGLYEEAAQRITDSWKVLSSSSSSSSKKRFISTLSFPFHFFVHFVIL